MRQLKLFLASSSELKEDRIAFELFIGRKNKALVAKGVFLELIIWEDFLDTVSAEGLQKEYNKAIRACDIFVMLYFTKVGKYTAEEFEAAIGSFQEGGRPLIYTFFKDAAVNTGAINRNDLLSLFDFQDKLRKLGHYQTQYKSAEDLQLKFGLQLDKLADEGLFGEAWTSSPPPQTQAEPPTSKQAEPPTQTAPSQVQQMPPASSKTPPQYLLANIIKLFQNAYDSVSLETFAMIHFNEVYQQFTPNMVQALRINTLVSQAQKFGRMGDLLAAVEAENSYQYAQCGPYTKP